MGLLQKILRTIFVAVYMTLFGILYTILHPIGVKRNEPLKKKARQLNLQAAKDLNCGASSVFVKLANGINLHVVEAGERNEKLIVLLHGFPDCWHCWARIIPDLVKEGYFVVAPDMRGYNLSDKPQDVKDYYLDVLAKDVKELIEIYGKRTATVVAHDWGGVVAWKFAERYPEMLDKLVICNAPDIKVYKRVLSKSINQVLGSWYIFWFQIPYLAQNFITYDPLKSANRFFNTRRKDALNAEDKELLACSYVQDGALPAMLNYYKALIRQIILDAFKSIGKKTEKVQKMPVPTLILWGENDPALVRELAQCSEFVAKVQVIYIPNCTHWVPYEVPEIVSREVIKFVSA